jgi:Family of unknown function (DUF6011)
MTTTYKIQPGQPVRPAQADLYRRLATEAGRDAEYIDEVLATLDRAGVSARIDQLIAARRAASAAAPRTAPRTEPGYYQDADDDVFVVVKSRRSDRTYAKRLVIRHDVDGDARAAWEYMPGAVYGLEGLTPLTIEAAARLGHLHGICVICAKQLTDPASVERGIGPVCVKRLAA